MFRCLFFSLVLHWCQCGWGQNLVAADSFKRPRRVSFTPNSFSNFFSLSVNPVLEVNSGDTIETETIDALGFDKNGVKRQRGGNPLTGPFYVLNSKPGDVLKITFRRIALNRPYAYTSEAFVSRSMPDSLRSHFKKPHLVKWKLDLENGFASPDSSYIPYNNLQEFKVPLRPFLGCIGVAPRNKRNEVLSFFQGDFGGNLDFNRVTQASTIYLPVLHDGAYFFVGDGHALQGDGEIAGNALETSLDVEFTIELIRGDVLQVRFPRVEDSVHLMAIGTARDLDEAIKIATAELLDWLQHDYQLNLQEATQVMSTTIEYAIAEIADPEVIIVAKIKKASLRDLKMAH